MAVSNGKQTLIFKPSVNGFIVYSSPTPQGLGLFLGLQNGRNFSRSVNR
jgi:hypothetical protein